MSISLNNVNSEVVRAHKRIDDFKLSTKWIYLGDLRKNNASISVPQNAIELNMIHYDLSSSNDNGVSTVTSVIPVDLNTKINIRFEAGGAEMSITPYVDYKDRVVKMVSIYDNNYTKVYYR